MRPKAPRQCEEMVVERSSYQRPYAHTCTHNARPDSPYCTVHQPDYVDPRRRSGPSLRTSVRIARITGKSKSS